MLPLKYVLDLLCFLLPFCLANPILNQERSEELSLEQNSISHQNSSVDGWGDCITCAAKCGLFFCTCSLACSPTTPIEPWACYVRGFNISYPVMRDYDIRGEASVLDLALPRTSPLWRSR